MTVGLTALAAVLGYAFREFQNRARPLVAITRVEGDFTRAATSVAVPEATVIALRSSFFITRLESPDTLAEVRKSRVKAKEVKARAEGFLKLCDSIVTAAKAGGATDVVSPLSKLLDPHDYDYWLTLMLEKDRVQVGKIEDGKEVVISTYPSENFKGSVWFGFAGSATNFGLNFQNNPIRREKCADFIAMVSKLDLGAMADFFTAAREAVQEELRIAKDVEPVLNDLLDSNSRWELQVFLANLGRMPFLILTEGTIKVKDKTTGASFSEAASLMLRKETEKGQTDRRTSLSPVVVKSAGDISFSFFTKKTQGEMERGGAFRDVFSARQAECTVEFRIEKPGFQRFQKLRPPFASFREGLVAQEIWEPT